MAVEVTQNLTQVTISSVGVQGPKGEKGDSGEIQDVSVLATTSSFNSFTASYLSDSASFANRIESATNEQDLSGYLSASIFNNLSGSFNSFTASYLSDSASFANRIESATNEQDLSGYLSASSFNSFTSSLDGKTLVSSSNQIEEYELFATQGPNEFDGDQIINGFVSASAGVYTNLISPLVGSDTTNLTATNLSGDNLTVNSLIVTGSVGGDAFQRIATTGSNTFIGNQTISGSIRLEGDTIDNGINFGTGNTYVGTAEGFLYIKDEGGYIQIDAQNPTNYAQIILAADNEDFFYVNHETTDNTLKFTTNGNLLLNEIPYDAHLATTGSNTFVGNQIVNGFIESQYNGVTQGSLGNGPSGFSLNGEDDKTFGITLSDSVTGPVSWIFQPNGELGVPGNVNGAPNLATTGSNSFIGDQNVLGTLYLLDNSNTSSIALSGGDLEITAPDNTGVSINTYNTSTDTLYTWYFDSSGDLRLPGNRIISTSTNDITLQPFDDLRLYGGDSTDENNEGGDVIIRGGDGPDEVGGTISTAGDITIRGGHGGSGSIDSGGNGGDVTIFGGDSLTEAVGGVVRIYGGYGYDNFGSVFIGTAGPNEVEFNENSGELLGPLWTIDRGTIYLDTTTQDQKIYFGPTSDASYIGTNFGPLEIYDSSGDFKINSTNVTIEGQLNVTSSLVVTGSVEVVGSITASIVSSSYMKFDSLPNGTAPTHQEGLLYYDSDMGALTFYNDEADISLQIGQENYVRAINVSGDDILNGTPVRVSGSQGDRVKIYKAEAFIHTGSYNDSEAHNHILGIATHDILNNETGYVTITGLVKGINTDIYEAGDILYVQTGSAGVLTNVAPPFPYDKIQVGIVGRKHATVGEVLVLPKEPTHFGNITGLSGSATTEVGDLWVYKSNSAWATSKTLEGDYTITGSLTIEGSGSLNGDNIVSSNTIQKIETISSASYAALNPPVSGTLYIII